MKSYEPRTIALGAELIHAPIQLEVRRVQAIHNELYHRPELSYQNFQVAQDGVHLSNPAAQPGQVSVATFRPDRIMLREEFRDGTIEDFATRLVNVVGTAWRQLHVPQSFVQVLWARSLVSPQHWTDSRRLFVERILGGGTDAMATFERPIAQTTVSLSFAPADPSQPAVDLRIAPWLQEPRSVWFEVVGKFTAPIAPDRVPELGTALYSTYAFLTGPALRWLEGFDRP
ncbi:MAG: hypothetical protein IPM29_01410 [Planctomycetes bacterium]|nr:hypothetical protein [Planctomycetota bacterium]